MNEKDFKALMEKFQKDAKPFVEGLVKEALEGLITSDQLTEKLGEFAQQTVHDELKTIVEENKSAVEAQGLEINKLKVKDSEPKSFKDSINEAFAADGLTDKIKAVFEAGSGVVDVIGKAVGNITTGAVSTDTGGNALLDLLNADDIASIRLRDQFIENYCTVTRTNKPVYTYADYVPKEGDVDFVLEAGTKPQLDLQIEVRTATPKKAAGHEIMTEESIQDIPRMETEARTLLLKKYLLKRQSGILFGDGTGANPTGITQIAQAFNPATWTGKKKADPNLYDAIIAAKNQIEVAANYTDDVDYYPNVVFVNNARYNALLIEQSDKVYTFNQVQGKEPVRVAGVDILAKKEIPDEKLLIGDFTLLRVINYIDYNIKIGYINDQLIKNLFTMVGEGRFYTVVKYYDQLAFVYDDIQNIIDGITSEEA